VCLADGPAGRGRFEDVTCAVPSSRFTRSHWGAGSGAAGAAAAAASAKAGSAGAGAPVRAAEEGLVELQPRTDGCSERDMMGAHARGGARDGARDGKARPSVARAVLSRRPGRLAGRHIASDVGLARCASGSTACSQCESIIFEIFLKLPLVVNHPFYVFRTPVDVRDIELVLLQGRLTPAVTSPCY